MFFLVWTLITHHWQYEACVINKIFPADILPRCYVKKATNKDS